MNWQTSDGSTPESLWPGDPLRHLFFYGTKTYVHPSDKQVNSNTLSVLMREFPACSQAIWILDTEARYFLSGTRVNGKDMMLPCHLTKPVKLLIYTGLEVHPSVSEHVLFVSFRAAAYFQKFFHSKFTLNTMEGITQGSWTPNPNITYRVLNPMRKPVSLYGGGLRICKYLQ